MRAILTYHSVDRSGSVVSIDPRTFLDHVEWLVSEHVSVLSVADLLTTEHEGPAVAVTFDDAFANFATDAWPALRAHGVPVTLFVPTGFVGRTNSWPAMPGGRMPTLSLLDWDALGRLADEGVTLAAHSRTHADLRQLGKAELQDEIGGSVSDLEERIGHRPKGFAYPYGYLDEQAVAVARKMCSWAVTTDLRDLRGGEDSHRLPRIDACYLRGPGRLEDFGRRRFRLWLAARRAVRAARGVL